MSQTRNWPALTTALALFAMMFGSGNIAFPLGLGRDLGSATFYAMIGFFATAVIVPVISVIAMALYDGDYREFMHRIGTLPGSLVIFLCFLLMGPFVVIPRCMAFSYVAASWMMPSLSLLLFSLVAGIIILLATWNKTGVIDLLGMVLGPAKILLLGTVIVKGLTIPANIANCTMSDWTSFAQGLFVGYGTLDMVGILLCSGLLISGLRRDSHGHERLLKQRVTLLIKAGIIAAFMLGIMYAGFGIVSSHQSADPSCIGVEESQLLSVLAAIVLGVRGGYLASVTMIVACLTTAIALTTVFAEYLSAEARMFGYTLSYRHSLLMTIITAVCFANLGAAGIKAFLLPIVFALYPALLALAIANICWKLWHINMSKFAFYFVLSISLSYQAYGYYVTKHVKSTEIIQENQPETV